MDIRQRLKEISEDAAVREWLDSRKPFDVYAAALVASHWHGGMSSGLYSFSSSGHVNENALAEVYQDISECTANDQTSEIPALCALAEFLRTHLEPIAGTKFTKGYRIVRDLLLEDADSHDPWGSVLSAMGSCAEVLHHANEPIPESWGYRHAAVHDSDCEELDDDIAASELKDRIDRGEVEYTDMRNFGNTLDRCADILRTLGRDY